MFYAVPRHVHVAERRVKGTVNHEHSNNGDIDQPTRPVIIAVPEDPLYLQPDRNCLAVPLTSSESAKASNTYHSVRVVEVRERRVQKRVYYALI